MVEFFSQSFSIQIDECNLSFAFKCLIIRWKSICQHLHSFETPLTFKCFLIYSLLIVFFKKNTEMKKKLQRQTNAKTIKKEYTLKTYLLEKYLDSFSNWMRNNPVALVHCHIQPINCPYYISYSTKL